MVALGITEACAGGLIERQASNAGGRGARCAPSGEREGQRRVADRAPASARGGVRGEGERGTRVADREAAIASGTARGEAASHQGHYLIREWRARGAEPPGI